MHKKSKQIIRPKSPLYVQKKNKGRIGEIIYVKERERKKGSRICMLDLQIKWIDNGRLTTLAQHIWAGNIIKVKLEPKGSVPTEGETDSKKSITPGGESDDHEDDKEEINRRKELKEGSKVLVMDEQGTREWYKGKILKIGIDEKGEYLYIEWRPEGSKHYKSVSRFSPIIKPDNEQNRLDMEEVNQDLRKKRKEWKKHSILEVCYREKPGDVPRWCKGLIKEIQKKGEAERLLVVCRVEKDGEKEKWKQICVERHAEIIRPLP